MNHQTTKLLVKKILENPSGYLWSLQGLGMLRLYLSTEVRLHVWDSRFRIADVSTVHNHPWGFESYIVAGRVKQYRFKPVAETHHHVESFLCSVLKCGAGNCERTPPESAFLFRQLEESYGEGHLYHQHADEIHDSAPDDGTVTLVTRHFTKEDVDHARVFWPSGTEWVSAEPRPATPAEVYEITSFALAMWFPVHPIPTTVEEVRIAEEAMKNEPPVVLPESLKDPYELMRRHPEVFGSGE
jgi:hypothetical protein